MSKKSGFRTNDAQGSSEPWSMSMAHECRLSSFWEKRFLALGKRSSHSRGGQLFAISLLLILVALPTLRLGTRPAIAQETAASPAGLTAEAKPAPLAAAPALPRPETGRQFQLLNAPDLVAAKDTITMKVGGQVTISAPKSRRVSSSQPDVFTAKSTDVGRYSVVTLEAKQSGVGILTQEFIDAEKTETKITVVVNSNPLRQDLRKAGFKSVRITPIVHGVILSGECDSAELRNQCIAIADKRFPSVVNNIRVNGEDSVVQLDLKVFEYNADSKSVTELLEQVFDMTKQSPNGRMFVRLADADAFDKESVTLMTSGVAKLIAEPTLTTVSGRPAAFHVGNEFPILIPGGDNTVAVEYRQTGTRVDMVPIVTGKHRLQLEVRPSVTTLEKPSKFEFKGVESSETISSFERPVRESNEPDKRLLADIPTFVSRHVETTADMSHDGTLIVAMVDQDTQDKTKSKCLITMLRPQIMNQTRVARSISTVATPRVPMEFAPPRPDSPTVIDRTTKQR